MAGQGMERREVLRVMAMASVAARFPGFHRWSFVCDHVGSNEGGSRPGRYVPQFFTSREYAIIEHLAEMIIPSDETPGAQEAGVSEFIDFMVWSDPSVQERFRSGITWLDVRCYKTYGKSFGDLASGQQSEILARLAYKDRFEEGDEDGRAFFHLMRDYTVMGYYTTKIGLEQIDCPALQHVYPESPACPHTDDRAHDHLPPPKV
jgi:Gluconate 2-dehydrogenase subunit 3